MHKILVSVGVLIVAGLIGYTTTKTVLNNNELQTAGVMNLFNPWYKKTNSAGDSIVEVSPYVNPSKGGVDVGISGSVNLGNIPKKPCWAEEQTVQGLFDQINQTNDPIVKTSLRKSQTIANNLLWRCLQKIKTPMPPEKDLPVGIPAVKTTPAGKSPSIMPINSGAKPLPSSNYKLINKGKQLGQ